MKRHNPLQLLSFDELMVSCISSADDPNLQLEFISTAWECATDPNHFNRIVRAASNRDPVATYILMQSFRPNSCPADILHYLEYCDISEEAVRRMPDHFLATFDSVLSRRAFGMMLAGGDSALVAKQLRAKLDRLAIIKRYASWPFVGNLVGNLLR